jgi:hypothetical protein
MRDRLKFVGFFSFFLTFLIALNLRILNLNFRKALYLLYAF